ncbi:IS110 family transposase [Natrinema soli]|uniref:IS110 family transposase n=1 Tax=Natrinema soli TaxID=1930624 RepID=A0ABD5SN65_9EURY|nr:IS110 family transposase [Natrinema soli]
MNSETEFIGMDIHDGYSQIAVMDPDGTVLDSRRLSDADVENFAREHADAKVAIEASSVYRHIYDTLDEHVDVTLVNPKKTRVIAEAKVKTDKIDAKMLAHLLRADLIAESYVPPADIRRRRDLVRERKRLIDDRTRYKNRIRSTLKQSGNAMRRSPFSNEGREQLAALELDPIDRKRIESSFRMIDELTDEIATYDAEIRKIAREDEQVQLLETITGVGSISAVTVTAEIGEIERFGSAEKLVSYAGLDPTVQQSGQRETRGPISKEGSSVLRWMLVQCANNVVMHRNEYFVEFFDRLNRRKNKYVARVATARKVLVSMYHMLTRGEEFAPPSG